MTSWAGEPTARRGGRRKKHYRLLPAGAAELRLVIDDNGSSGSVAECAEVNNDRAVDNTFCD